MTVVAITELPGIMEASRRIAELEAALAASEARLAEAVELLEELSNVCDTINGERLLGRLVAHERDAKGWLAAHPPRDPDELVSKRDGWWWVNGDDKTRHSTKVEAVRAANARVGEREETR